MKEKQSPPSAVRIEKVTAGHDGQRLDNYLVSKLASAPRSLIYKIIRTGQVRLNGGRARPNSRLAEGDLVRIPPVRLTDTETARVPDMVRHELAQRVIYEDADLLVIDKPAGIAVHGGSGVSWGVIDALRQLRPGEEIELVHRLDRETSGCLCLARNKKAMRDLHRQFRESSPDKRYLALMDGRLPEPVVLVDRPLLKVQRGGEHYVRVDPEGKEARTEFHLLEQRGRASYVEVRLHTGRTHQIRAHAADLGLPLAGDARYASPEQLGKWRALGLARLFLHAHHLSLESPAGDILSFHCPLPAQLKEILDRL